MKMLRKYTVADVHLVHTLCVQFICNCMVRCPRFWRLLTKYNEDHFVTKHTAFTSSQDISMLTHQRAHTPSFYAFFYKFFFHSLCVSTYKAHEHYSSVAIVEMFSLYLLYHGNLWCCSDRF